MEMKPKEFMESSKDKFIMINIPDFVMYENICQFRCYNDAINIKSLNHCYLNQMSSIPAISFEKKEIIKLKDFLNNYFDKNVNIHYLKGITNDRT